VLRDGNAREGKGGGTVDAPGWVICGIGTAGSEDRKSAADAGFIRSDEGVDALENVVDTFVVMSPDSPAFNDADVLWLVQDARESGKKELKADCFCSCDVPLGRLCSPTGDKSPGSPPAANHDCDTDTRASIRECLRVEERRGE
jgi:hypothetical protein